MNPQYQPACKVCERGVLVPTKIYRMSGPVVAIGYILLIPSILGMVASALMFFGIIGYNGTESSTVTNEPTQSVQEDFATGFRRSCVNKPAPSMPLSVTEQYCECALSAYKLSLRNLISNSAQVADDACEQRWENGTLDVVDQETQHLYSSLIGHSNPPSTAEAKTAQRRSLFPRFFNIIGGGFAIALGVASFVSGILGWLFIMKKRVLKCSVCGATVSAS